MADQPQPQSLQFAIDRIYVKDLSIELPGAPIMFKSGLDHKIGLHVNIEHKQIDGPLHEVTLRLTVEGKKENTDCFIIEVKQAGLFRVEGAPAEAMAHVLRVYCPNVLFPYARQSVDQALQMASLPPLMLAPIDFEHLSQDGGQAH